MRNSGWMSRCMLCSFPHLKWSWIVLYRFSELSAELIWMTTDLEEIKKQNQIQWFPPQPIYWHSPRAFLWQDRSASSCTNSSVVWSGLLAVPQSSSWPAKSRHSSFCPNTWLRSNWYSIRGSAYSPRESTDSLCYNLFSYVALRGGTGCSLPIPFWFLEAQLH